MKNDRLGTTIPENYDAGDIIGARMTAIEDTKIFDYISADGLDGKLLAIILKGSYVGIVNSYLVKNGQLWWEIRNPNPTQYGTNYFYVKHDQRNITVNPDDIYQSPADIEAAIPTLTDRIIETVLKVVTIGAVVYGVSKLVTGVTVAKINKGSSNNNQPQN